jgi:hypothetical protein
LTLEWNHLKSAKVEKDNYIKLKTKNDRDKQS